MNGKQAKRLRRAVKTGLGPGVPEREGQLTKLVNYVDDFGVVVATKYTLKNAPRTLRAINKRLKRMRNEYERRDKGIPTRVPCSKSRKVTRVCEALADKEPGQGEGKERSSCATSETSVPGIA
jgi:hypothetical protein